MRWIHLARKDLGDAIRSWHLYYFAGALGVLGLVLGYLMSDVQTGGQQDPDALAGTLLTAFSLLGPILALAISQYVIVGKRASGELSVLLSLPFSRLDVVLGSFVGRVAVASIAVLTAFVTAPLVATVRGMPVAVDSLIGAYLLAVTLTVIFTAIAVGISAYTRSTTVAAAGSFSAFLLFVFQLWSLIPTGVRFLLNGLSLPSGEAPMWALAFEQFSPFAGLRNAAHPVFADVLPGLQLVPGSIDPAEPWYQDPVVGTAVVLLWIVLPLFIGYHRLQHTDL